jgi:hypothetical protein
MTIKSLYPTERPVLGLNFYNSKQLDPRLTFARASTATYVGSDKLLKTAVSGAPRFGFNPVTGDSLGLLLESGRTNLLFPSNIGNTVLNDSGSVTLSTDTTVLDPFGTTNGVLKCIHTTQTPGYFRRGQSFSLTAGVTYSFSFFFKNGTVATPYGQAADTIGILISTYSPTFQTFGQSLNTNAAYPNGWYQQTITFTPSYTQTYQITFNQVVNQAPIGTYYLWGFQFEQGSCVTSYIPTTSAAVARSADQLSISNGIPTTGSLFLDSKAIDIGAGRTLVSIANSSNNKLLLQNQQPNNLYGSTGLVYSINGTYKPTLPFPVSTINREYNLITWGASNYHYRANSSRFIASASVDVPANMNRIDIGFDSTDATKGFNGYINSIYMWTGELQPSVATAIVKGSINLKDADATETIPSNAFSLIFNTQGIDTTGDVNITLPLRGNTNNIRVDWGDTTTSTLIGSSANSNINHVYPAAGIYRTLITSADDGTNRDLKSLSFGGSSFANDLYRIQQWGGVFKPTTMNQAFSGCTKLDLETAARTNLPDTSAVTDWTSAFSGCNSITGTFPTFNTTAATNLSYTWYGCNGLTSAFPSITTSSVTNFNYAWSSCFRLTSFPALTTSAGTTFEGTWRSCSGLTSFPTLTTSSATNLAFAWQDCSGLTAFPTINTSSCQNFYGTWSGCSGLTAFPSLTTTAGTNFASAWGGCSGLTSFPSLNFAGATGLASDSINSATGFRGTWQGCTNLATFPTNRFTVNTCTRYLDAFTDCALTAASIENIIVSINSPALSNGNLSLQGGTNAAKSTWTTAANNAYNALVSRGWTITYNA